MIEASWMCKICGHRTHDKTKPHECATINAVVHKGNEFIPRSGVDTMIANCVNDIKRNIGKFAELHGEEIDKIHPKMIITLIITNVTINLFLDAYQQTSNFEATREALNELLSSVNSMVSEGIEALYTTTASTKTTH